jgi:hypothetical protein
MDPVAHTTDGRWLLLIHHIPPKPSYLRVKVWRRLQRLGAVALKNSVYVLPKSEQAQEDLQWVLREITEGGGDASICEARFVDGISDAQIEALFHAARDADYAQLAEEAREALDKLPVGVVEEGPPKAEADLVRLRRRLAEVANIDFFGAPGHEAAEGFVAALETRLFRIVNTNGQRRVEPAQLRGRTWVTRKNIHIDRMASAWLIRRFIDPDATFAFVPGKTYEVKPGELRFDMFDGEYTHEGDRCTFEVLLERFVVDDPALRPIAQIIHDIDLKDAKFARPETPGIERLVAGIAVAHREDEARLARASAVLDDLYELYRRKER